jgi:hypothetical protein
MIRTHVVRAGEYLAKIAHNAGLDPEAIWNHPKNAELRARRPDRNILSEGDVLFLSVEDPAPLSLQIGGANRYAATVPEVETHIRFGNAKEPYANEPYVVEGLDERVEGTTDAEGGLTITAPVTIRVVNVRLPTRGLKFSVRLGDMDPISEVSGVQLRLSSLGYLKAPSSGTLDEATTEALRSFQAKAGIERTGTMDPATLEALKAAYGC